MRRSANVLDAEVATLAPASDETPSNDSLWYAELLRRGISVTAIWRDAGIWPLLAGVCMLVSTFAVAWTNISLVQISGPWSIPIDLGWGIRIPLLTYGLICTLTALWLIWRGMMAVPWRVVRRADSQLLRFRPLTPRGLFGLGTLVMAIPALYLFQFLLADFGRVTQLASQENQSLLIRLHLGYALPKTHLIFTAFQFDTTSIGDRWALLVQVSDLGILLAVFAALICWLGAFRVLKMRQREGVESPETEQVERTEVRFGWFRSRRQAVLTAACVFAVLVLARPVASTLFDRQARAALDAGSPASALTLFNWASALNPLLQSQPSFHQDRGAALWALGNPNTQDAQLYLAAQYRGLSDLNDAWTTDYALYQQFPQSQAVEQDLALTYEQLAEQYNVLDSTQVDDQNAARNPQVFTMPQTVSGALPWLDQLIRLEPNNVYALYARGRTLYRMHSYELAAKDFQAILPLAGDNDMLSTAYTYLALCRGGLGDYVGERTLLLRAVELDNGYSNTTARQNASGLH